MVIRSNEKFVTNRNVELREERYDFSMVKSKREVYTEEWDKKYWIRRNTGSEKLRNGNEKKMI